MESLSLEQENIIKDIRNLKDRILRKNKKKLKQLKMEYL